MAPLYWKRWDPVLVHQWYMQVDIRIPQNALCSSSVKVKYCCLIVPLHHLAQERSSLHLYFFYTYRSIYLTYEEEYKLKNIKLYRFSPPAEVFGNTTVNPDNEGFCVPDNSSCLDSGVLSVSRCKREWIQWGNIQLGNVNQLHSLEHYLFV